MLKVSWDSISYYRWITIIYFTADENIIGAPKILDIFWSICNIGKRYGNNQDRSCQGEILSYINLQICIISMFNICGYRKQVSFLLKNKIFFFKREIRGNYLYSSVGFRVRLCTILGTPMYYKYTRCNIEPTC